MIFIADSKDIPEIALLSLNIPKELGLDKFPEPDLGTVTEYFFDQWVKYPIFIFKEDGEIKGFIATQVQSPWWSKEPLILDYATFVKPEHRSGGRVFNALVAAVKDYSKLNKMQVLLTFLSGDRTEVKERFLAQRGFEKCGFLMRFKGD